MAFCDTCRRILDEGADALRRSSDTQPGQFVTPSVDYDGGLIQRTAADIGCYICRCLLRHPYAPPSRLCEVTVSGPHWSLSGDWYALNFEFRYSAGINRKAHFNIRQNDAGVAALGAASAQSTYTGSPANFELAKHWLATCRKTHDRCRSNENPTWYPSRLLRIDNDRIVLLETADLTLSAPYATLSYVWGPWPFHHLSAENISAYKSGIPTTDLPPLFKDAFRITSSLGLSYIWIDSLCIIQSSGSDAEDIFSEKLHEVASMHKVYANAMVNLAAVHCQTPLESFFVHRTPLENLKRHFLWCPEAGSVAKAYCLQALNGSYEEIYRNTNNLERRAWAMQERLLAPRMLCFSDRLLYWQCFESGIAHELLPEGLWAHLIEQEPFDVLLSDIHERGLWARVIERYSAKQLTFPMQDKLLALSAIAAQAAGKFNDTYAVGCFRRHLIFFLCWDRHIDLGKMKYIGIPWRLPTPELPSWSWASARDHVGYDDELERITSVSAEFEFLASISDIQINVKDSHNPYGAIYGATLTMTGKVMPVKSALRKGEPRDSIFDINVAGTCLQCVPRELFWSEEDLQLNRDRLYFLPLFLTLAAITLDGSVFRGLADALDTSPEMRENFIETHALHGLLLARLANGSYERIYFLQQVSAGVLFAWADMVDEQITMV